MTARRTPPRKPRAIAVALPMDGSAWSAALAGVVTVLASIAALLLLR